MTIPIPPYNAPFLPVPQVTPLTYRDGVTMLKKLDDLKKYINRVLVPFVNENYEELAEAFETQVNALIEQVNAAIEIIINDGVQVQDPVMAGIMADIDSETRAITDALYAPFSVSTDVAALETLTETGRLSESELWKSFGTGYIATDSRWGADASGAIDATAALNSLFAACGADGVNAYIPAGTYTISSGDLIIPWNVAVYGAGANLVKITTGGSPAPNRKVKLKGGGPGFAGPWQPIIQGISFEYVGILGGEEEDDAANGLILRDIDVSYATIGVEARFNCWLWTFDNVRIRLCGTGVFFNFDEVPSNSGANMAFSNSRIFDCSVAGFHQDGIAIDGSHVSFVNTDIEHCAVSIKVTDAPGATFDVGTGCHFELNTDSYVQANTGVFFMSEFWMFSLSGSSKVAFFDLSGNARVVVTSGRIGWASGEALHKIADTAILYIDPVRVLTPAAWAIADDATYPGNPLASSGGTAGMKVTSGPIINRHVRDLDIPASASTNAVVFTYAPGDATIYELEMTVEIQGTGTNSNVALFVNPGALATFTLALPATTGYATVKLRVSRTRAEYEWSHTNGSKGQGLSATYAGTLSSRMSIEIRRSAANDMTLAPRIRSYRVSALA